MSRLGDVGMFTSGSPVTELRNAKDHNDFVRNNERVIVFYGSKSCPHCVEATPFFSSLANESARENRGIEFAHVETSNTKVNGLQGVPTFVGYINEELFDTVVGADKNKLKRMAIDMSSR